MAITISNAVSVPAISYDHIYLEALEIKHSMGASETQPMPFKVYIRFRYYGVDTSNNRHYKDSVEVISIDDYLALAQTKAAAGDNTLLNAFASLEAALAQIIADQKNVTTSVV